MYWPVNTYKKTPNIAKNKIFKLKLNKELVSEYLTKLSLTINNENNDFLAIATSGEYRNFKLDKDGNKITHTINPLTLSSIDNNILSVTVINEYSATYSDAYATAFNAMGMNKAIEIANKNEIATMIIYRNDNDVIDIVFSDKWYDLFIWMS